MATDLFVPHLYRDSTKMNPKEYRLKLLFNKIKIAFPSLQAIDLRTNKPRPTLNTLLQSKALVNLTKLKPLPLSTKLASPVSF